MNPADLPKGTIILEPQNVMNRAIIDFDEVLIYSYTKLVESLVDEYDWSYEEAIDYIEYNIMNMNVSGFPIIIDDWTIEGD